MPITLMCDTLYYMSLPCYSKWFSPSSFCHYPDTARISDQQHTEASGPCLPPEPLTSGRGWYHGRRTGITSCRYRRTPVMYVRKTTGQATATAST